MNIKNHSFNRLSRKITFGLLALLVAGSQSWAVDYVFSVTTGTTTTSWSTTNAWTPNSPVGGPGASDNMNFTFSNSVTVQSINLALANSGSARNINTISKTGTVRLDIIGNSNVDASILNAQTINSTTGALVFRDAGTAGLSVNVGNISVTSTGNLNFGLSNLAVANPLRQLNVSGTTTVNATTGFMALNIVNSNSNSYSLGVFEVNGGGVYLNRLNISAGAKGTTHANVLGLSGTGGLIQSSDITSFATNQTVLAINNSANFSSSSVIRDGATGTTYGYISIAKSGSGTQTLSGSNSYSGGTTVNAGTLLVTSTNGLGTGAVSVSEGVLRVNALSGSGAIANAVTITDGDGSYVLERASGMAFSAYTASSDIAGGKDTTASLLAGTASTTRTLTTGFDATSSATNDGQRASDVFSLNGTGTDLFVLQLQITDVVATQYLGWLDGSNTWVNSVTGNNGVNNASGLQLDYAGSFASFQGTYGTDLSTYRGAYGFDESANTVWAVLDHNSDFAVVPEPQTVFLAAFSLGLVVLLGVKRRKLAKSA